jgi:hypothetical protein
MLYGDRGRETLASATPIREHRHERDPQHAPAPNSSTAWERFRLHQPVRSYLTEDPRPRAEGRAPQRLCLRGDSGKRLQPSLANRQSRVAPEELFEARRGRHDRREQASGSVTDVLPGVRRPSGYENE